MIIWKRCSFNLKNICSSQHKCRIGSYLKMFCVSGIAWVCIDNPFSGNVRNPRFHGTNSGITVVLAIWSALWIFKISSYHTIFSYFQYLTVYHIHNSLLTNFTLIFTYDIQDCPKCWLFIPEREFVKWMATDWPALFSNIVPSF